MKYTRIASVLAWGLAAGVICAPLASADAAEPTAPSTTSLGSQAKLVNGDVIQGWTVSNLKPSSDVIPYQPVGTLWEATATDQALQGSATPIVSNLNARAADGQTYRALFGVATPQGVNPATLSQGQETSGKVYFDVTGSAPTSVVYNSGGQDLAVWTQAPPAAGSGSTARSYPSTSYPSTGGTTAAPASMPATTAPEGTTAAPTATGAEAVPAGSQGTPLPEGTPATPGAAVPAGSQGTPLAPGEPAPAAAPVEGATVPAANQPTPQPAGSQGTPIPADQVPVPADQVPTPTIYEPTP